MKTPTWLSTIGGPNALSIWTWLLSLIWTVAVIGLLEPLQQGRFTYGWLFAVIASQAIIGLALWVAIRAVLPKPGNRPRPAAVLAVLIALGVVRAVTMQAASNITNYDDGFTLADRLVFGIGYSLVFGVLIALVVDGARTHATTIAHLRSAQEELKADLDRDATELDRLHEDLVRDVQDELLAGLSQSDLAPEHIRGWARDVVRRLSHELAELADAPGERDRPFELEPSSVPVSDRVKLILSAMRPPPIPGVLAIVQSLAFLVLLQYESPDIALAHATIGAAFITAALLIFTRVYRPATRPVANAALIAVGLTAMATISVLGTDVLVRALFPAANSYPIYIVSILIISLALSTYQAVRSKQMTAEEVLAQTVRELIAERQRVETAIRSARSRSSKFLHDSIQGILYAAALSESPASKVRQDIARAFQEFTEPAAAPTPVEMRANFDRIVDMWGNVLELTVSIDETTAIDAFSHIPTSHRVIEATSEGLTNAAKHGRTGPVHLHLITTDSNDLLVVIDSPGRLDPGQSPTLGLQRLNELANNWSLTSDGASTRLQVAIQRSR